jgi:predicted MFS family arabinose efflux permease
VLTVYLLSASVATPILGLVGDIFGKEHLTLVVLGVFAVGCPVAALSHSLAVLVAARATGCRRRGVSPGLRDHPRRVPT